MAAIRKADEPVHSFTLPTQGRTLPMLQGHDCVVALKALGEDTRVRIVSLLLEESLEVGEIARRLGISQYNASKHLRILREAGLLELEKDGRRHLYALPEAMRKSADASRVLDLGCCSFQFNAGNDGRVEQRQRRRTVRVAARR